ncbi:ATP-binding cassette domain-containing protein [Thalassococcus sp. CAU 1522]|uniref:ATP-binding cassette domain-containing protein n=1 Tax=Thalassococcus arenae TaxID=2851652 RepID=A0ABS6N454_9RHOB|nr:oligopeptide/dipeptide ABC transporter ATP-binding protein [Thalassococcus arenae]MBV2358374.1 ATP-binding cassette domain-containing protein [Thalassococcus arenae]
MTALLSLRDISQTYVSSPDLAERIANLAGANYRETRVRAVNGVSFDVAEGEVVGLVGESGCGKSTLGRMVVGVERPASGTLAWRGTALEDMTQAERRQWELEVQMIFQDPFASLNPRMRVEQIVGEAAVIHGLIRRSERRDYVADLLNKVGLGADVMTRYPHQFSGGQRQRIGIARALALRPKLIVCDEAISALDVSIQAQVLNLFEDLRHEFGFAYLFISHDLGAVEHIADRVAIMYLGRLVEIGTADEVFENPRHPYTRALLAEAPRLDRRGQKFTPIEGEIPSPLNPPPGCAFHPRCTQATDACRRQVPTLRSGKDGRLTACILEHGEPV